MPSPTCSRLQQDLADIKALQHVFLEALDRARETGEMEHALKLKAEIETKMAELKENIRQEKREKIASSITGVLSELLDNGADQDSIARGLAGVGTPEAMAMRKELLNNKADKDYIARGLAGVGTPEAMAMRKELLDNGANQDFIARGLAGVNNKSGVAFRERYFSSDPTQHARSYSTNSLILDGVVCRYGWEY